MYSVEKKNQPQVKSPSTSYEDKANNIQPQVAPQLKSVSASNVMQLQRLIGNRAVQRLVAQQQPRHAWWLPRDYHAIRVRWLRAGRRAGIAQS